MGAVSGFFNNSEIYEPSKAEIDRIKEETYYLVKFSYPNYDFPLEGFALLNGIDKEFFDNITNDQLSLVEDITDYKNIDEWKNCYTWEAISDEERCTINVLIGRCGYFFYPEIEGE